jgi:hypothetical protein
MNDGRPTTLVGLEYQNDVAVLGLINRLRFHHLVLTSRLHQDDSLRDIADDVNMAVTVLDFMLRNRDDMK